MIVNIPTDFDAELKGMGFDINRREWDQKATPLNLRFLTQEQMDKLEEILKAKPEGAGVRRQISGWKKNIEDPANAKPGTLNVAEAAFIDLFIAKAENGWMFTIEDKPRAYRIHDVRYEPAGRDYPASLTVSMRYRTYKDFNYHSISWSGEDIKNRSLIEMLAAQGYQLGTPELVADYEERLKKFQHILNQFGKQVVLTEFTAKPKDWRQRDEETVNLAALGGGRMVVNMDKVGKEDNDRRNARRNHARTSINDSGSPMEHALEQKFGDDPLRKGPFTVTPWHFGVRCYHLEAHDNFDVDATLLEEYKYDDQIREKLVLPPEQMELLDTLTDELNLLQEDLVAGKTGGNVIMLGGLPGLGKTLTAEVYAEACKVPLLKIHSGQLGTNPETIEKRLREFYALASAWGETIILLDEFDVFGRARGNDLIQNAVVAVFLRTLEYQSNTIFLTTNRINEMDDAIISRCAAMISYGEPKGPELKRMWKVLRDQFLKSLTDDMIEELTAPTENGKTLSGRDIKGILRLADRYERKGHEVNAALIRKCAGFRGIQHV